MVKTLSGFKNPKVHSKMSINKAVQNLNLDKNHQLDLRVVQPKDSLEILKILLSAMDGQIILFDSKGKRKCYKGNESCPAIQFKDINNNFNTHVSDCDDNEQSNITFGFDTLDSLLKRTVNIYDKQLNASNLPKADYYAIYNWSLFVASEKHLVEDYRRFEQYLANSDKKIEIIRMNCDLINEWGLKEQARLKLNFVKNEGKTYRLKFGKIPYSKNNP
jgi:hypothetical protein